MEKKRKEPPHASNIFVAREFRWLRRRLGARWGVLALGLRLGIKLEYTTADDTCDDTHESR